MGRFELVGQVALKVGAQKNDFQSKDNLLRAVRQAMDELGIIDKKMRQAVATAVRVEPEYIGALKAIRLKECAKHQPISGDSPLEHLPLPMRAFNCLKRWGQKTVFDLLSLLAEEGATGFLRIRNFGQGALEDTFEALSWAEPIQLGVEQLDLLAGKLMRRLVRDEDLVGILLSLEGEPGELEEQPEMPSTFIPLDEEQIGRANILLQFPGMKIVKGCLSLKNQLMVVLLLEDQPEHCLGDDTFGGLVTVPLAVDQINFILAGLPA